MVRQGSDEECWPWRTGKRGRFNWADKHGRRVQSLSSRVAYVLTYGEIPKGLVVAHSCDNPPCCNPAHLSAITQRENVLQAVARGRHVSQVGPRYRETRFPGPRARGERNGAARLTNAQVSEIRQLRRDGLTLRAIAERYETTYQYVWSLVHGRSRKQVD